MVTFFPIWVKNQVPGSYYTKKYILNEFKVKTLAMKTLGKFLENIRHLSSQNGLPQ